MTLQDYSERLAGEVMTRRYDTSTERAFSDGLEETLRLLEWPYERERRISTGDRLDFLVADGLAVEVKVDGRWAAVLRQLDRYARAKEVRFILLVTARSIVATELPSALRGVPLRSVVYRRFA